jgi:Collagen triple helix repeat (20 copies)
MSTLRTRFGIPGIISTIALVFAMTGGAFAAKYLITSPSQIKPSVLKKLKGPQGATGAAGAQGPAGAAGAPGEKGANGTNGTNGAPGAKGADGTNGDDGTSVAVTEVALGLEECNELGGAIVEEEAPGGTSVEVCNGKEGKDGEKGEPWAPDGNLPPGATLTGTWSFSGTTADTEGVYAPIGFSLLMPKAVKRNLAMGDVHAHFQTDPGFETHCEGSFNLPLAKPGELCVYIGDIEGAEFDTMTRLTRSGEIEGANRVGTVLHFDMTGVGFGMGSWAVTGCSTALPPGSGGCF